MKKSDFLSNKLNEIVMVSVLASVSLVPILALIFFLSPADKADVDGFLDFFVGHIKPEGRERLLYLTGVILTPALITLYTFYMPPKLREIARQNTFLFFFSCCGILFLLASFKKTHYTLLQESFLFSSPILFILSIFFIKLSSFSRLTDKIKAVLLKGIPLFVFLIILLVSLMQITFDNVIVQHEGNKHHFGVLLYGIQQSFIGKVVLHDFLHLYGQYPIFLTPIFKLIGLSIFKISLVFSLLTASSLSFLWFGINNLIKVKLNSFLVFVSIIYFNFVFNSLGGNELNIYYQYIPLRTFFPALLLFMFSLFVNRPSRKLLSLGTSLSVLAIFWNLDTGLIVFITWNASTLFYYLSYEKNKPKEVILKFLALLGISIVTLAILTTTYKLAYGVYPAFESLFYYQKIFYKTGFAMEPMSFFHMWNIVLFTYILALSYSLKRFFTKQASVYSIQLFFLSILGFGLFVYYQGRSKDAVFSFVWYPAIIIMGFFFERLKLLFESVEMPFNKSYHLLRFFFQSIVLVALFSLVANIPHLVRKISFYSKDSSYFSSQENPFLSMDFIDKYIPQADSEVFFLSYNNSPFYYYGTKSKSFCNVSDLNSIFTTDVVAKIANCLTENSKYPVVIDSSYRENSWPAVNEAIKLNYTLEKKSERAVEIWLPK